MPDPEVNAEPGRAGHAGALLKAAFFGLLLVYPFIVYLGAGVLDLRVLAVLLILAGLGRITGVFLLERKTPLRTQMIFAGCALAAVAAISLFAGDPAALYYYPVLINLLLLALFAASLIHPPSIIERLARLSEPDLPPEGQRYTKRVTLVWCVFFTLNAAASLATVLSGSAELWLLYNGFIAYILMGLLFAGEYLVRRRVKRGAMVRG